MTSNREEYPGFFRNALTWSGSITPKIIGLVFAFSLHSLIITYFFIDHPALAFDIGPFEISGAAIGLLLVLRTNAGYDRWWEARKLWGNIVNQSRNLCISALRYGPDDIEWKKSLIRWTAAFSIIAKYYLRKEKEETLELYFLTEKERKQLQTSPHSPNYAASQLAHLLAIAKEQKLDGFSFLSMEEERRALVDSLGGCERILNTPIPRVLAINVRFFILVFLLSVPFVLVQKVGWYTPLFMLIVTYPLLSLDQIGVELQNPFKIQNLSHLPLNETVSNLVKELLELLEGPT